MAMNKFRILGGRPLEGSITIGGAKNAALPLMAAGLLTAERLELPKRSAGSAFHWQPVRST